MEYIQADIWVRFQRMQGHEVHFVCADDTHGAPIMLEGGGRGHHAGAADRARRAVARRGLAALPHQLRHDALDAFAGERRARAVDLPQAARPPAVADRPQDDRAVLRSGQGDVPRRSLHQGHVPQVRREGPVRRRLRSVRLDLRADRPHRSLLDADRGAARAARSPSTCSSGCPTRRSIAFLERWTRETSLQPEVFNKIQEWLGDGGPRAERLGHLARRALLRHRRSPTSPASTSTSGSTRRSATSPR